MADPWTQALAEAYATADVTKVILDTIEIRHPALLSGEAPAPLRLVRAMRAFNLRLEVGAPLNSNQVVAFRPLLFDLDLPESSESAPTAALRLDAVDQSIVTALETIMPVRADLAVTYRAYLEPASGDPAPSPQLVIDGLKATRVKITPLRCTAQLSFDQMQSRAFPSGVYTRRDFPGLAR